MREYSLLPREFLGPARVITKLEPHLIYCLVTHSMAVSLWDCKKKIGGMCHYMFPYAKYAKTSSALYGNVAIEMLAETMKSLGSLNSDLEAMIYGGADFPEVSDLQKKVGQRNIEVARDVLGKLGIEISGEHLGGFMGKKIVFNTGNNEVLVKDVSKLSHIQGLPTEFPGFDRKPPR